MEHVYNNYYNNDNTIYKKQQLVDFCLYYDQLVFYFFNKTRRDIQFNDTSRTLCCLYGTSYQFVNMNLIPRMLLLNFLNI